MAESPDAFAHTVAADDTPASAATAQTVDVGGATLATDAPSGHTSTDTVRTTGRAAVLPLATEQGTLVHDDRDRYARKRVLGAGGMGEVVLAEDQDIGRDVAVKYLLAPHDPTGLARFIDEIRTVGLLEHPNIVPIHDVGVDDAERYFFVMKHVEGETLEQIIERLAAGDPDYHARYTFTARVALFMGLLRALDFAHARGYVHRDLKPANVMVGRYGEVVLMDWGVAKRCGSQAHAQPQPTADAARAEAEADASRNVTARERFFTTRRGALVGTPAYMSPEQARGEVETIDERSDIYSACALFYELLSLRHYLGERENLTAMLLAVQSEMPSFTFAGTTHAAQGSPPAELLHFAHRGLEKDPAARFASVREMIDQLEATLDGRVKVQCPVTFTKRLTRELGRFVDRRPLVAMNLLFGGAAAVLLLVVLCAVLLVRAV